MATTLSHDLVSDPLIHEPKGVSSAGVDTVYTANGTGSGAWSAIPGVVSNVVIVNELSNFPTPLVGVITLASDTVYQIAGGVDVGDSRFALSGSTAFVGNNQILDIITSSTTGALFTSTGSSLRLDGVGLIAPLGSIFNITNPGAEVTAIFMENSFIGSCASVGTIADVFIFTFRKSALLESTVAGLSFLGSIGSLKIGDANFADYVGTAVDLGTATFDEVFIGPAVIFDSEAGQTGLNVAAASANINAGGRGFIFNSAFVGAGTATVGLDSGDILWDVQDTNGVSDTANGAQGSIIGNAAATVFGGTGIGNKVAVNFNSVFIADTVKRFTLSSAGVLSCLSKESKLYYIDTRIFAQIAGGASRQYVYLYVKNSTEIVSSSTKSEYDGSSPGSGSVSTLVELTDTDTLQLFVYAITATTSLTVDTASMTIFAQA